LGFVLTEIALASKTRRKTEAIPPLNSTSTAEQIRHKVLLVDDDAVSLELMALLLAHEGHQVVRANDAGAALEVLASEQASRPDVMLVDLQMPGVSGGQLAEKIRALKIPPPLLLAMSATEVQRKLPVFDGFLLKPFAVDEFRKALDGKKRDTRAAPPISAKLSKNTSLDPAVVRKLRGMMPAQALHDTVAACIADTKTSIDVIKKSLGNSERIRHYAHRIKGAAAMIGATRLTKVAAELEAGGDKGAATLHDLDDLVNACDELQRMLLAGKFTGSQGPHDNHNHRSHS
jgi:CheY-like chemotaxis protein/HPt (histidine-containing phosphotransfer) domain-containing protein